MQPYLRSLALVSALALLVTMAGCEPQTDNAQRKIYCTVTGDPPQRNSDDNPTRIEAQARFWCDKPGADSLTLTVRLQRRTANGAWADVARSTFTVRGSQTVRTDSERYRTRTVSVACASGTFRTSVQGRSVARGRTKNYSFTGGGSVDPCRTSLG